MDSCSGCALHKGAYRRGAIKCCTGLHKPRGRALKNHWPALGGWVLFSHLFAQKEGAVLQLTHQEGVLFQFHTNACKYDHIYEPWQEVDLPS